MEKNEIRDNMLRGYQSLLLDIFSRAHWEMSNAKNEDEILKIKTNTNSLVYNTFRTYREMLTSINVDYMYDDSVFRKPTTEEYNEVYKDEKGNEYPICRILTYRGIDYNEYIDDYGTQTFIVYNNKTIPTEYDWDYVLDYCLDVELLSNQDTYEQSVNIIVERLKNMMK